MVYYSRKEKRLYCFLKIRERNAFDCLLNENCALYEERHFEIQRKKYRMVEKAADTGKYRCDRSARRDRVRWVVTIVSMTGRRAVWEGMHPTYGKCDQNLGFGFSTASGSRWGGGQYGAWKCQARRRAVCFDQVGQAREYGCEVEESLAGTAPGYLSNSQIFIVPWREIF